MLELNPDSFVIYAMAEGFKPDPMLTVSEWADENRYLSSVASSEPGRWHTERTPYLKEIMDCLSPSDPCEKVVCSGVKPRMDSSRPMEAISTPPITPGAATAAMPCISTKLT